MKQDIKRLFTNDNAWRTLVTNYSVTTKHQAYGWRIHLSAGVP